MPPVASRSRPARAEPLPVLAEARVALNVLAAVLARSSRLRRLFVDAGAGSSASAIRQRYGTVSRDSPAEVPLLPCTAPAILQ